MYSVHCTPRKIAQFTCIKQALEIITINKVARKLAPKILKLVCIDENQFLNDERLYLEAVGSVFIQANFFIVLWRLSIK